jgi:cytochrome c oxidase subunit 4
MAQHGHDGHGHAPHVVPLGVYFAVFAALMLGTWLTVMAAHQDFGRYNTAVALAIAITKASLVVVFFMHVKYSPRLITLVVVGSFVWLAILLFITLSDYWTRGGLGTPGS